MIVASMKYLFLQINKAGALILKLVMILRKKVEIN